MKIQSSVFNEGMQLPVRYTCSGEEISPPLEFLDIPKDAKSLVLIMDDPDAPGGIFTHWLMWNINPAEGMLLEGETPENSIEGMNSGGRIGYFPPCPPIGETHHYVFRLYALNNILHLDDGSSRFQLEQEINGYIIDQAELIGLYGRNGEGE